MKCKSDKCDAEAVCDVFWPGQLTQKCWPCWLQAAQVANVMGFELQMRLFVPIDIDELLKDPPCDEN